MRKVDWSNPLYIDMKLSGRTSMGQLSTYDYANLTALVFLAHDHCIRVDIEPCSGTHFKLMFHPRAGRHEVVQRQHPTLEQAVEYWRAQHQSKEIAEPQLASSEH